MLLVRCNRFARTAAAWNGGTMTTLQLQAVRAWIEINNAGRLDELRDDLRIDQRTFNKRNPDAAWHRRSPIHPRNTMATEFSDATSLNEDECLAEFQAELLPNWSDVACEQIIAFAEQIKAKGAA